MVNLREIDRQFRPSDRQPGINNEGRGGIEQFFRDVGSALQNTGTKYNRFQDARNDMYSKGQLPIDYNQDTLRYIGNSLAGSAEQIGDIFQLVPEALSQAAGSITGNEFLSNRGSGVGLGDTLYNLNRNYNPFANFDDIYDQERAAYHQANELYDGPTSFYDFSDPDAIFGNTSFQNYLRGKGFSVQDDFGADQFRDQVILPQIQSFDDYRNDNLFTIDQPFEGRKYNDETEFTNALINKYNESVFAPAADRIYDSIVDDFTSGYVDRGVESIANSLGVSDQLAESMLMNEQPNYDLGLFTDLFDERYEPFEYATDEGREFYGEDTTMDLLGSLFGYGTTARTAGNALKANKYINNTVGQLYPLSTGKRIPDFPLRSGKDGAKYSFTVPFLTAPASRSVIQGGGILGLSDAITSDR